MTTTTADRPQPSPPGAGTRPDAPWDGPRLTGPPIPVPPATHPAGDLVHPWAD
ncbi:hypothetical protein [Cellulomonas sp. JZ18]|uniref:hypothetical protein n=1 Tax=Cellulomonas sp. JZ18 TaxID=2654191 RepID=UPI0012D44311|nr:hypothetical protein [Cellulomonas sp. JZ18]